MRESEKMVKKRDCHEPASKEYLGSGPPRGLLLAATVENRIPIGLLGSCFTYSTWKDYYLQGALDWVTAELTLLVASAHQMGAPATGIAPPTWMAPPTWTALPTWTAPPAWMAPPMPCCKLRTDTLGVREAALGNMERR